MGKGNGGSTTTVDPAFNAGLLKIYQQEAGFANEMQNMFKYGVTYDPTEKVSGYVDKSGKFVQGKPEKIPSESHGIFGNRMEDANPGRKYITKTRGEIEGYDPNAQTSELEYLQNVLNAKQETLEGETEVRKGFLDSVNKEIDVGERMDEAQAGVQHGFKLADKERTMDLQSFGLDPSSGRYASTDRAISIAKSTGIAGARTAAKNQAEDEDFRRKSTGLQLLR